MNRKAVSLTLAAENLLWLRAQAAGGRNMSRIVDDLIGRARSVHGSARVAHSVVGMIRFKDFDPDVADREIREMFGLEAESPTQMADRRALRNRESAALDDTG